MDEIIVSNTEVCVMDSAIHTTFLKDGNQEEIKKVEEAITKEIRKPLYEFAGVLTPAGEHHRYTRKVESKI